MNSDLFVALAGLDPSAVERVIPPSCRRAIDSGHATNDGETAIIESPVWIPRQGARHLVPSFSLLDATPCSFRFEASVLTDDDVWTPWAATATIGPAPLGDHAAGPGRSSAPESLVAEVDMYIASRAVRAVRLRARVHPADALARPWMMALSTSDLAPLAPTPAGRIALRVPPRSQMEERAELRDRICSPTCVAMVLEFWGHRVEVSPLADEIYHPGLDLYGVWPAAIHAAARRGVAGFLLRFPDWASASWCLGQGVPLIASIRFEPGEMDGAPIARTGGHLVVLTGEDGGDVLVNDPAAPSAREAPRRYRRDQFARVWLERGGVGYVLFPPRAGSPSAA